MAFASIALCWLTAAFGSWAFGRRAGFYAGLVLSPPASDYSFSRAFLIPDVMLTCTIAWRCGLFCAPLDDEEPHPRLLGRHSRRKSGTGPAPERA